MPSKERERRSRQNYLGKGGGGRGQRGGLKPCETGYSQARRENNLRDCGGDEGGSGERGCYDGRTEEAVEKKRGGKREFAVESGPIMTMA